jgi:hypothetical protein
MLCAYHRHMTRSTMLLLLACACSASAEEKAEKQRECDQIATDIRKGAEARDVPSQGACGSTNPRAADLQAACERLRRCNQEYDDL